jgi:hypothetical protein
MRLLMTLPPFPVSAVSSQLSLVKFLLPLAQDADHLSHSLGAIDTVCHLGSLAHEIVAVDDASVDGTAAEARRYAHFMPLWLIQHRRPMGRAIAFRTALEAACRDVADDDLLIPLDPSCPVDVPAVLRAISAAHAGCDAVRAPATSAVSRPLSRMAPQDVTVFRAALVQSHLDRFLESPPSTDGDATRQLDRYFVEAGVPIRHLTLASLETPVRGRLETVPSFAASGRVWG